MDRAAPLTVDMPLHNLMAFWAGIPTRLMMIWVSREEFYYCVDLTSFLKDEILFCLARSAHFRPPTQHGRK
jgi:hypothetical protein